MPLLLGPPAAVVAGSLLLAMGFPWPQAGIGSILVLSIGLWSSSTLAPPLAGLMVIALLPVLRVTNFEAAVAGLASGTVWLFLSVSILAIALRKVGIVAWVADWVVRLGRGNASRTLLAMMGAILLLTTAVPTAVARSGLVALLLDGIVAAYGREREDIPRAFALGAAMSVFAFQLSVMTGTNGALYAVAWFELHGPVSITFGRWLALMAPLGIIQALLVWWVLRREYRLDRVRVDRATGGQKKLLLSGQQARVLAVFAVLLLVWVLGPWAGLPIHPYTLLFATLLCVPKVGVLVWEDLKEGIPWGTALLLASAIAVGDAFKQTGMGTVLGAYLTEAMGGIPDWLVTFAVLLAFLVGRILFVNLLSLLVTLLPLVASVGQDLGFNPVWLVLLGLYTGSMGFFLPAQSPVAVTLAAQGDLPLVELSRLGMRLAPLWVAVLLVSAYTWWPLLGLRPFP
ncbi:SLC13 family permease [Caldinitratiruptor microaerophilus]|uniref:SLC13 family permease n=1 Tax=Caldinitratiruptor microaerophilus TaxID=671077 RepID=UPI002230C573|nr:SLC13 family permease [Caldinitratiruptor microaerophilus]